MNCNLSFDMIKATRDKTGLVQVQRQVTRGGKTFMQNFWVKPGDVKPTDKVTDKPQTPAPTKQADQSTDPKSMLVGLLTNHGRDAVIKHAESIGITWKKDAHAGINWMRASMAIKKSIQSDSSKWSSLSGQDNNTQNTQPKPDTTPNTQDDNQKPQKSQPSGSSDAKNKLSSLLSDNNNDRNKVIELAKKFGVTWKENDKEGINWMRASMSIQKSLKENPGLFDSKPQDPMQSQLDQTTKKVNKLENIVASLQDTQPVPDDTVKVLSEKQKNEKLLEGLDLGSKSDYEKNNFKDILEKSTPTSFRNYRTLGMCAGDDESEQYLSRLYSKYVDAMKQTEQDELTKPNVLIDSDAVRNKLSGVVNKSIVNVVKSSTKGIRKKTLGFVVQQKIMEPWVDPNLSISDAEKQKINQENNGLALSAARGNALTEPNLNHDMLHRILDKLGSTQEYGNLAKEYDAKLTEYDDLTHHNQEIQNYLNGYKNSNPDEAKDWVNRGLENSLKEAEDKYNIFATAVDRLKAAGSDQSDIDSYSNILHTREEEVKLRKQILQDLDSISGDDLIKAKDLRKSMFSSKFTDLNANLYHSRMIASELSKQYWINRNFVDEYPVLTKDNIDKLESGDVDTITNLALTAGAFKPSLSKNGANAQDVLKAKFEERRDILNLYGGVTVTTSVDYSENNDIKCKISKASPQKSQEIENNIAADWDRRNHGGMHYKIKGIYEVTGLEVNNEFKQIQQKSQGTSLSPCKYLDKKQTGDLFYHGTGPMATSLILGHSGQFKVGKIKVGRMLGDGIYLADKSSKSAQYISDTGFGREKLDGSLMIVEAVLGNTKLNDDPYIDKNTDTVYASTKNNNLRNNEWCVRNPKAVIPRYLVEMEVN